MKNKDKFNNEIVDIVCNGDTLAVDKTTNKPVYCTNTPCWDCLLYSAGNCFSNRLIDWSNQEYKEPIVISRADINFLSYIKDEFEYLARDSDGRLFAYSVNPNKYKDYGMWFGYDTINLFKYDVNFPMVKYSDEQAWKISDLKKLKVVEKY